MPGRYLGHQAERPFPTDAGRSARVSEAATTTITRLQGKAREGVGRQAKDSVHAAKGKIALSLADKGASMAAKPR
jgi:hypothetical protein